MFDAHRRRNLDRFQKMLLIGTILVAGFLFNAFWQTTRVDVALVGLADDQYLSIDAMESLAIRLDIAPVDRLADAEVRLDGEILDDATILEAGLHWELQDPITVGEHELSLRIPRPMLSPAAFDWTFTVDPTPPEIDVPLLLDPVDFGEGVLIEGRVDEPVELLAAGVPVEVGPAGGFRIELDEAPLGSLRLDATDRAGHRTTAEVFVPIERPMTRGVHMTAISWAHDELRAGVLRLIDEGKINTVELDLKDEGGDIGYETELPLARRIGADRELYNLEEAVADLKERGVRVVGRLVAFRDPILADWAWRTGRRDYVIQTTDGQPHPSYDGFTNFASPEVRAYNIDVALEAAEAGVDEILWDYVRRPEGPLEEMVIPGLRGRPQDAIISFLAESHRPLRDAEVLQGASVFGIAAARPDPVGQHVPEMSRHLDVVAPMVYPSLWVSGEYQVSDPPRMPYEIVRASLEDFQIETAGTGVTLVPWLQDFSLGAEYLDEQVQAQIEAAGDIGIDGWLLWSPRVRYHAGDIEPIDPADS